MKRLWLLFVLILTLAVTACAKTPEPTASVAKATATTKTEPSAAGQLQIAGSTTVQPLAEQLAEAFMAKNSGIQITVQGGGSSVGVTSAGEGTVDIGTSSRELQKAETDKFPNLKVFTIAFDGIAVVTNPGVKLPNLTKAQARDIFSGKITNLKDVGGPDASIIVVSREEGSGTRTAFEEMVMTYTDSAGKKLTDKIVDKALLQQSNGQIRTTVATTPNSIAYLSFGFLDNTINATAVEGIAPTVENAKNKTYPVVRPLIMLTNGEPNERAKAFLDFCLSDEGQAIVAKEYVTVK